MNLKNTNMELFKSIFKGSNQCVKTYIVVSTYLLYRSWTTSDFAIYIQNWFQVSKTVTFHWSCCGWYLLHSRLMKNSL